MLEETRDLIVLTYRRAGEKLGQVETLRFIQSVARNAQSQGLLINGDQLKVLFTQLSPLAPIPEYQTEDLFALGAIAFETGKEDARAGLLDMATGALNRFPALTPEELAGILMIQVAYIQSDLPAPSIEEALSFYKQT